MNGLSVIIPAHNEERHLPRCLASVRAAAEQVAPRAVDVVVVLNRCTDATETIARGAGARVVVEDEPNLARIRNAGVRAGTGDWVVTIDADSWMTPNMLAEIVLRLETGRYVGGGARIRTERMSAGIFFSTMTFALRLARRGISAGLFWLPHRTFEALDGFNEELVCSEDVDFALRLKAYGADRGLCYGTVRRAHITTSCRKFDQFGDWFLFRNRRLIGRLLGGRNREAADHFYYDIRR